MLGPKLHANSDLKKNYKFVWALDKKGTDLQGGFMGMVTAYVNQAKKVAELSAKIAKVFASMKAKDNGASLAVSTLDLLVTVALMNGTLLDYVSQLAKSVDLPSDELEMDEYEIGPIKYPVPKSKKLNDITVTYYDDTYDTVYNFHKSWIERIVPKTMTGANSFAMRAFGFPENNFCWRATYATYENTLNSADYGIAGWGNRIMSATKGAVQNAVRSVVGGAGMQALSTAGGVIKNLNPFGGVDVDPYLKYKFKQEFKQIFPVQVERSVSDVGGTELATVKVVYRRIPDIIGILNKPYSGTNNFGY